MAPGSGDRHERERELEGAEDQSAPPRANDQEAGGEPREGATYEDGQPIDADGPSGASGGDYFRQRRGVGSRQARRTTAGRNDVEGPEHELSRAMLPDRCRSAVSRKAAANRRVRPERARTVRQGKSQPRARVRFRRARPKRPPRAGPYRCVAWWGPRHAHRGISARSRRSAWEAMLSDSASVLRAYPALHACGLQSARICLQVRWQGGCAASLSGKRHEGS